MKILVIGGTGTISTGIAHMLLERGEDVTLYTRGKTEATFDEEYKSIIGDRTDHATFEAQMAQADRFDVVIDMIGYNVKDAHSAVRAFKGRCGRFIFCSTVDVYTKGQRLCPIREVAERAPSTDFRYGHQKARMEKIFEAAHADGGLPLTIIRPAATYSERGIVFGLAGSGEYVLGRIRKGEPVIVLGDGSSFWVSCHRDDVARAFLGAIDNPDSIGRAYHTAGEEWMTWEEYFSTAARVMGAPPIDFVHIPTELLVKMAPRAAAWSGLNFRYNNLFDNASARADLGFAYTTTWEQGLRQMVDFYDKGGTIDGRDPEPIYGKIVETWRETVGGLCSIEG